MVRYSIPACSFCVISCSGSSSSLRLGATLFFATYFLAVLIVSVFAGVPAGIATAISALIIVGWVYVPPYYAFGSLTASEYANFSLYAFAASLIIWLAIYIELLSLSFCKTSVKRTFEYTG